MRALVLVSSMLLGACGGTVPLVELEHQAMASGDWSAVERRERILQRRAERAGPNCRFGLIAYCIDTSGSMRCQCINANSLYDGFASRR